MDADLERAFHRRMVRLYERAKREAGYNATYFLRMLAVHGGVETARRLVANESPSDGFTQLYLKNKLDLTVEAAVLEAEFEALFEPELIEMARARLESYDYR